MAARSEMRYAALAILVAPGAACADGARIGLEYEWEKDRKTGIVNHAVTVKPGWEFSRESPVNVVELLIDRSKDATPDSTGSRAAETKLFLRIRRNGKLTESIAYHIRGGVGRGFNDERSFNYAYIEPGLKHEFDEKWEWTFAIRAIDSIDGTEGRKVVKFITGPSLSLDKNNELEIRYAKSTGDKSVASWAIGYVHKF